jgi:hypothetical protein
MGGVLWNTRREQHITQEQAIKYTQGQERGRGGGGLVIDSSNRFRSRAKGSEGRMGPSCPRSGIPPTSRNSTVRIRKLCIQTPRRRLLSQPMSALR